jgi:hypothetical protein
VQHHRDGGPKGSIWALLAADVGASLRRSTPATGVGRRAANGKPEPVAGLEDPFAQLSITEQFYERVHAMAGAYGPASAAGRGGDGDRHHGSYLPQGGHRDSLVDWDSESDLPPFPGGVDAGGKHS